jgi:hypothetical protein
MDEMDRIYKQTLKDAEGEKKSSQMTGAGMGGMGGGYGGSGGMNRAAARRAKRGGR